MGLIMGAVIGVPVVVVQNEGIVYDTIFLKRKN